MDSAEAEKGLENRIGCRRPVVPRLGVVGRIRCGGFAGQALRGHPRKGAPADWLV